MQVTLTRPMEAFVQRQIAQGYSNEGEVVRQALLRWMFEEAEALENIQERLDEASNGQFKTGDRASIEQIMASR